VFLFSIFGSVSFSCEIDFVRAQFLYEPLSGQMADFHTDNFPLISTLFV